MGFAKPGLAYTEQVVALAAARLTLPTDPDVLPQGWYLLFGMVDDIPSVVSSLLGIP